MIDLHTRECLAITVGQSLKGEDVKHTLERIKADGGWQQMIKTDNGSEFADKVMDRWAYDNDSKIDFLPIGQANGKRHGRVVQRQSPDRVLERYLVPVTG